MSTKQRLSVYAQVGSVWAVIALLLGFAASGKAPWAAALSAPFIGMVIGWLFESIDKRGRAGRIGLALISLYLAVALFGLALGSVDLVSGVRAGHYQLGSLEVLLEGAFAALWYVTFAGWFLILWPLTYLTHAYLGRWRARQGLGLF